MWPIWKATMAGGGALANRSRKRRWVRPILRLRLRGSESAQKIFKSAEVSVNSSLLYSPHTFPADVWCTEGPIWRTVQRCERRADLLKYIEICKDKNTKAHTYISFTNWPPLRPFRPSWLPPKFFYNPFQCHKPAGPRLLAQSPDGWRWTPGAFSLVRSLCEGVFQFAITLWAVHLTYNLYFLSCFFSQNNIFLS
jgi:hypothetical protein